MAAYPTEPAFLPNQIVSEVDGVLEALPGDTDQGDSNVRLRSLVHSMGKAKLLEYAAADSAKDVSSRAVCYARERLGHISPLHDLAFAMQGLGTFPIVFGASLALRQKWIPAVIRGELVAAFALTEADAGSDLAGISTRAEPTPDGYVLNGEKIFISNAGVASFYSLFAVTDGAAGKRRLSAFVVPGDSPGLSVQAQQVLGDHPIGNVRLENVRVRETDRIGEEGDGLSLALATLAKFRPTVGAAALGMAQRAFDEAVVHVKSRHQFGVPLSDQQLVRAMIAEMACDLESARLLVYRAAAVADAGGSRSEIARTASMGKLIATEHAQRVIDNAVQLLGGRGVLRDGICGRLYEEIRALRIYEGTTQIQKLLIARDFLG